MLQSIAQDILSYTRIFFNKNNELKSIKWMNRKALPNEAYCPTPIEHIANIITHGIWVMPSIMATMHMLDRAHTTPQYVSALVYGATLIFLFSVSTSFHCVFYCNKHRNLKDVLHRCDRGMIYIFIAGSYFPWLTIEQLPNEGWASSMNWIVWVMAFLGIVYQQTFHEKYKTLETLFYLFMGIGPSLTILTEHLISGITELSIGGLLYVLGVIFFKCDGVFPFAHAVWHLFVVMAAAVHYYAVLKYLY
ncbi:unnamed protein product [Brassicogethes aeneus]|uniref:Uncharacterized protein n=1 Tax=Brassicogethes aeneus TaxID=1431903 RepID=A0A9P0BGX7_BRAAE|nr:unnamed protein product [Brassicogethes aeneus]